MKSAKSKTIMNHIICASVLNVLLLIGCSSLLEQLGYDDSLVATDTSPKFPDPEIQWERQDLRILVFENLLNTHWDTLLSSTYITPLDSDSLELFAYKGREYYHPVNMCHRAFLFLATFWHTKDTVYLKRAEKIAQKWIELSHYDLDRAWLPYKFDFRLHGENKLLFKFPWYSGMAQGELLSLNVRLYEVTGNAEYMEFANKLFKTISTPSVPGPHRWASRLDSLGYFWIEEYPLAHSPGQTLNGYILAMSGIYDYYRVTGSEESRYLWDYCVTTLKHYIPQFRQPGATSLYCLGHRLAATPGYHKLHISLFEWLFSCTGDEFFSQAAEDFRADTDALAQPTNPDARL